MKKPKLRPGSLSLPVDEPPTPSVLDEWVCPPPPFMTQAEWNQRQEESRTRELEQPRIERDHVMSELRKARTKAEKLAGQVRDAVFVEWVRRCVLPAHVPSEWTKARELYENYLLHAKTIGRNRSQRREIVLELATETQWGRMMATCFPKKRRTAGWFYPLRCKRG